MQFIILKIISVLSQQLAGPETNFFLVLYPTDCRVQDLLATFLLLFHMKCVQPVWAEHNFWHIKAVFNFLSIVALSFIPQSEKMV